MNTPIKIPGSLTMSIRFEFAYTLEQLAKYFQVNPEAILANPGPYVKLMIETDVLHIITPYGLSRGYYTALVLGAKDLEVTNLTQEVTNE